MLISLNWLKRGLGQITVSDDELIKLIGARLVEVEGVLDQSTKYDNIFCVQVKSCEKIPDTHLTLCKIDDGQKASDLVRDADGLVQVMCGAPNVHVGMFAVWIAPGAIVPSTFADAEPFVIGMRKMLKRYDSYGMMAGADELDLGDDHSGIVELNPADLKPGDSFADLFLSLNDKILDIENKSLTHRPDAFGMLGFRREVAGILGQAFHSPDWYLNAQPHFTNDANVKLSIEADAELCPRYTAIVFSVQSAPATTYLNEQATLLARSGMRPIDPIVDATNYAMLNYGQPLHAFDYDKFVAVGKTDEPKIIVRAAREGEKLTLLDGKEITMSPDDIVITSNDIPVALAGAMGGANTAIDSSTKRIILESASFSLYHLRKTQMAHGIFSEAITRFTKGQPVGQTLPVALRFAELTKDYLQPIAMFDTQSAPASAPTVTLELAQINRLLGSGFSIDDVKRLLENVEFSVAVSEQQLTVTVPFWRTDIAIPEDIIEEVGRLSGYDNLTPVLPLHATASPNPAMVLKSDLRQLLASFGANEALTYSFVHGDLLKKVGQDTQNSYRIVNSISPDLQFIRQSIAPSLLAKCYSNLRTGYHKFALFEMNQCYRRSDGCDEDGVPLNRHQLALVYVDDASDSNFYTAKHYLVQLLQRLGIQAEFAPFVGAEDASNSYYEAKRSANIMANGRVLGYLGEVKTSVLRQFKLPAGVAIFELALDELLALDRQAQRSFRLSQYPFVSRDLTVTVPAAANYGDFAAKLKAVLQDAGLIFRLSPTSIYQGEDATTKHLSFHLEFAHPDKTLTKAEIQDIMKQAESINN